IVDGVMHLDELGEFVTQVLQTIREHNRYAECILFVVMPNHIHAIFAIDLKNVPTAHFVGARHASPAMSYHDMYYSHSDYSLHIDPTKHTFCILGIAPRNS
ncbi:MAG: hypothetical protein ACFNLL_00595, partial [Bacteroides sp.]